MFRRLPPMHALAAFEAVARYLSFSRAADELCLTDSAVSHRIRQLEQHLGCRLFLRMSRQVALTPQGEAFLVSVRDCLQELEDSSWRLRNDGKLHLRISVLPAFASYWLLRRMDEFYAAHPDIELDIETTAQVVNLHNGSTRIGIRLGAGDYPGLDSFRLFNDCLFPVASPRYIERFGPIDSPEALEGAVLLRNRKVPWRQWTEAAGLPWTEPTSGPIFSDGGCVLDACISGQGVALGRTSLVAEAIEQGKLRAVGGFEARPRWHLYLVHSPESGQRVEVQKFKAWLFDTCERWERERRATFSCRDRLRIVGATGAATAAAAPARKAS